MISTSKYTTKDGKAFDVSESILTNQKELQKIDPTMMKQIVDTDSLMKRASCLTCRFWKPTEVRIDVLKGNPPFPVNGICRFNPPPFMDVSPFDWCGKFDPNS